MNTFRLNSLLIMVSACIATLPVIAQQKKTTPQANTQVATLQKQVRELTAERNALKARVDEIPDTLRQESAELYRQLDEANAQKEQALDELEQLKYTLRENQSGGDSLLRELQQTKNELDDSNSRIESLESEIASLRARTDGSANSKEGDLVHFGPEVVPAKCLNLRRMTPKVKRVSGIVVINCLISELGETLDVRLIQGLPGEETEHVTKAHEACLDAAKRLVFEPATNKDSGIKLKVWQGIAFYLN